jgi:hypothetical protein
MLSAIIADKNVHIFDSVLVCDSVTNEGDIVVYVVMVLCCVSSGYISPMCGFR